MKKMVSSLKMVMGYSVFMLILLILIHLSNAKPQGTWIYQKPKKPVDTCDDDEAKEIVCQYCAKRTKSDMVYPMCCNNEEDAFKWCERYLSFGLP